MTHSPSTPSHTHRPLNTPSHTLHTHQTPNNLWLSYLHGNQLSSTRIKWPFVNTRPHPLPVSYIHCMSVCTCTYSCVAHVTCNFVESQLFPSLQQMPQCVPRPLVSTRWGIPPLSTQSHPPRQSECGQWGVTMWMVARPLYHPAEHFNEPQDPRPFMQNELCTLYLLRSTKLGRVKRNS